VSTISLRDVKEKKKGSESAKKTRAHLASELGEVSLPWEQKPIITRSRKQLKKHPSTDLSPRWIKSTKTMMRTTSLVEKSSQPRSASNLLKLKRLSRTTTTKRRTITSRISASRQVSGRRKKISKASSLFS